MTNQGHSSLINLNHVDRELSSVDFAGISELYASTLDTRPNRKYKLQSTHEEHEFQFFEVLHLLLSVL
jgi:hypothetical protein